MMALSVISQPTNGVAKLSVITKIHKYRKFHDHDEHHFIPMAMKVHNTPRHDMDPFIKVCARLF